MKSPWARDGQKSTGRTGNLSLSLSLGVASSEPIFQDTTLFLSFLKSMFLYHSLKSIKKNNVELTPVGLLVGHFNSSIALCASERNHQIFSKRFTWHFRLHFCAPFGTILVRPSPSRRSGPSHTMAMHWEMRIDEASSKGSWPKAHFPDSYASSPSMAMG